MIPMLKQAPRGGDKKHNCLDCRYCQQCSDTRCNACRGDRCRPPRLTFSEQIALFEELNRDDPVRPDEPLRIV